MAISKGEYRRIVDKVRNDFHRSNEPLRSAYREVLRDLYREEHPESGEPMDRGCEDYLGIEDR